MLNYEMSQMFTAKIEAEIGEAKGDLYFLAEILRKDRIMRLEGKF